MDMQQHQAQHQHQHQQQHQHQYHQYHHLQNQYDQHDHDLGLNLKFGMHNPMAWTTVAGLPPPASASFSTDSTSLQNGECSPPSGRSTPRGIDLYASFSTDHSATSFGSTAAGSQFNLTPPPSAALMSAGFGFFPGHGPEPHQHGHPHTHFRPGPPPPAVLPLTPTRTLEEHYNLIKSEQSPLQELGFEHLNPHASGSGSAGAVTATAVIDPRQWTSSGHSSLASSPFHLDTSTPAHSSLLPESSNSSISSGGGHGGSGGAGSDDSCWDITAVSAVDNSSPVSFNGAALSQFEPASHGLSSAAISRRLHFDQAQHKTAILQQAQEVIQQQQQQAQQQVQQVQQAQQQQQRSANGSKKTSKWKIKAEDDGNDRGSDESPDGEPELFPASARGKFRCEYPSCTKAYKRNEHLKRHKFIQHCEAPVALECKFCDRTFNRADNLRAHIKLHSERRGRARVDYYPEAEDVLAAERKLMKGRGRSLSKKLSRAKRQQEQHQHQQAASHQQVGHQQQFQLLPLQSAQQQTLAPTHWPGNALLGAGWTMGP